jgi:Uma2 family endonuclease
MATAAPKRMTLAEFLEWDDGTDTRYELVEGEIRVLPLSLVAHGVILANLGYQIGTRLQESHRALIRVGVLIPAKENTSISPI